MRKVLPVAMLVAALLGASQDKPDVRLETVLKKLSAFAREIDSGKRELHKSREAERQPDGMMEEFRALVHENPALNRTVLKFLGSKEEPLGARSLAVLAIAQPHQDSVAELLGTFYADPPDTRLAVAAALGYSWSFNLGGNQDDWKMTLHYLPSDLSAAWRLPENYFGGPPIPESFAPRRVNLSPMLEGLLKLTDKPVSDPLQHLALGLAWSSVRRTEATPEQRQRLHSRMGKAYLEGGPGWHVATDYLTGMHATVKKPDVRLLGRGLARVDVRRQLTVMNEVAIFDADALFSPPFRDCIEKAVQQLSLPPKESGLQFGTMSHFLDALKARAIRDDELNKLLENPSETLGLRLSGIVK